MSYLCFVSGYTYFIMSNKKIPYHKILTKTPRSVHISKVLVSLHWLRIDIHLREINCNCMHILLRTSYFINIYYLYIIHTIISTP